jgi:hypothetical protein
MTSNVKVGQSALVVSRRFFLPYRNTQCFVKFTHGHHFPNPVPVDKTHDVGCKLQHPGCVQRFFFDGAGQYQEHPHGRLLHHLGPTRQHRHAPILGHTGSGHKLHHRDHTDGARRHPNLVDRPIGDESPDGDHSVAAGPAAESFCAGIAVESSHGQCTHRTRWIAQSDSLQCFREQYHQCRGGQIGGTSAQRRSTVIN